MILWYLGDMVFMLSGPVVGICILTGWSFYICGRPGYDAVEYLFSSKEESLSLASWETFASCNIINFIFDSWCSCWNNDSGHMVGSSVELFLMLSCDFSAVVHDILLISVL